MGIPKPTENTVTAFLKDELEKLGVKSIPFASLDTTAGRRDVEILCQNGGLYPIEAKFTESEAEAEKILSDLYESLHAEFEALREVS